MAQMPEVTHQEMREQLLARHGLDLHTHYLRHGPISPNLLASLRLAVGGQQYLDSVAKEKVSPLQVREAVSAIPDKSVAATALKCIEEVGSDCLWP